MESENSKHPPASIEAERSVLGAILLHADVFHVAAGVLHAEDFFRQAHQHIFAVMAGLPVATIDMVTVKNALGRLKLLDDCGGPAYLSSLVDGIPRSTNVESYAAIVREKAILRKIIETSREAIQRAYSASDESTAVIDGAFADLLTLSQQATGIGFQRASLALPAAMDQLEALSKPDGIGWGERTGLQALDRILRGLRPGKFIVLAARPSVGKSSLALNVSMAVSKTLKSVGVFSLEMATSELMQQLIASEARVNIEDLTDGKLDRTDWARVNEAFDTINRAPLYIDDSTDLTALSLRAKARRLQIEHGLALLVVDYVQLMAHKDTGRRKFQSREEELATVSRGLKLLAKDLQIPILACCQLNRESEKRDDHRPQLSDLRGTGSLEQDADVVILIHRPDMYPAKKSALRRKTADIIEEEIRKGVAELIIAKHRGGNTGTVRVIFHKEWTRFENLSL